jgi:acetyltransferase
MLSEGPFADEADVERIIAYHQRQDARFAQAAHDVSLATGKPILTATELAVAFADNAGPATVRSTGRLCYSSADRAVTALGHMWRHSRHRILRDLPLIDGCPEAFLPAENLLGGSVSSD